MLTIPEGRDGVYSDDSLLGKFTIPWLPEVYPFCEAIPVPNLSILVSSHCSPIHGSFFPAIQNISMCRSLAPCSFCLKLPPAVSHGASQPWSHIFWGLLFYFHENHLHSWKEMEVKGLTSKASGVLASSKEALPWHTGILQNSGPRQFLGKVPYGIPAESIMKPEAQMCTTKL